MSSAKEIISALALEPLAVEGGFFRETYRSREMISGPELPPGYPRDARRSLATCIYYLLTPDTFSEMHRLPHAEIYHVYVGGPVRMLQLRADGSGQEVLLGQLKRALVGMILRAQKDLPGLVQLDMRAKHISDWTLLDKFSDTPRARDVRAGVLNQKSPR